MKWEKKSLDELGTVSRGKSKHRPRNDPKLFGGAYPFIQTADIKYADYRIREYSETYNDVGLEQSKLWDSGTLCITIAANIADTAVLAFPACFPDSVMGFVPYPNVSDVRFVKACFDILQKECKQISQGTAQDNLSWEKLSTVKFPAPDYEVQARIGKILSAYDDLIENNQKQIKLLEEAAQRLYKEWFVNLRFPGYENVKIVDNKPEGWFSTSLENLSVLKAGGDRPKIFSVIRSKECSVPIYANGSDYEGLYGFTDKAVVNDKSITISARGNIGYTCLRRIPYVPIVRLICIIPPEDVLEYLYYVIKNSSIQGNGSAQQQLTIPMIKDFNVLLPSSNILHSFNDKVRVFLDYVEVLKGNITLLQEARDRLLPKLMSGEIEV